jgi:hypothetical protein
MHALRDGRPLTDEERAAFRARLLANSPRATVALWVRIQTAKCRQDAPHYRALIDPDTGKVEHTLAPCKHWPKGGARGQG